MAFRIPLHPELISLRRQHGSFRDQRQMVLLASRLAARTLSETMGFERWRDVLSLGRRWTSPPRCA